MKPSASLLTLTVLSTVSGLACLQVPHGARVQPGHFRSFSAGVGEAAFTTTPGCDTCTRTPTERRILTLAAQMTFGWGWGRQRVLGYVTIPLVSALGHVMAQNDGADEPLIYALTPLGTSLGVYQQLGPSSRAFAFGIGAMASVAPPQAQLYAMGGLDLGDVALTVGARAGVAKGFRLALPDDAPTWTTGGFASLRVLVGRTRVGLWVDIWAASRNNFEIPIETTTSRSLDRVLLAGVLIETR